MRLITLLTVFLCVSITKIHAFEQYKLSHFILTSDPEKPDRINIIAADSLEQPLSNFNGTYNFSVNGFRQILHFQDGIAASNIEVTESLFLYVKHENENDTVSKLYYVHKKPSGLNPISISWYILIAIPVGLILIGYMFRKLIGIAIFFLVAYVYFNYSKGLSFPTLIESVFDGLKSLF